MSWRASRPAGRWFVPEAVWEPRGDASKRMVVRQLPWRKELQLGRLSGRSELGLTFHHG